MTWDTRTSGGKTYFEVARAMRMKHHTISEIRATLRKLGMEVSYNAVVGKIDRAIKRGSIPTNTRVYRTAVAKPAARPIEYPAVDVMRYMDVKHPTLFNITEGQCSYLGCDIGMVGFLCCGKPTLPGRSFCETHHRLTHLPTRPLHISVIIATYCDGVAGADKRRYTKRARK